MNNIESCAGYLSKNSCFTTNTEDFLSYNNYQEALRKVEVLRNTLPNYWHFEVAKEGLVSV